MKKTILAVAAAFVLTLGMTSCSKDKAEQMISDLEELVEEAKAIKESGDITKAASFMQKAMELEEKYKDIDESDFTPEQRERIQQLTEELYF